MKSSGHERRQFGRRQTALHAWIRIPGRPPIACVVRNISVNGALLEFDVPEWMPYAFQLVIDSSRFEVDCELRHKGTNACGVMFVHQTADQRPAPRHVPIDTWAWTGGPDANRRRGS